MDLFIVYEDQTKGTKLIHRIDCSQATSLVLSSDEIEKRTFSSYNEISSFYQSSEKIYDCQYCHPSRGPENSKSTPPKSFFLKDVLKSLDSQWTAHVRLGTRASAIARAKLYLTRDYLIAGESLSKIEWFIQLNDIVEMELNELGAGSPEIKIITRNRKQVFIVLAKWDLDNKIFVAVKFIQPMSSATTPMKLSSLYQCINWINKINEVRHPLTRDN